MNIKETARTLASITVEQWEAILIASTQANGLEMLNPELTKEPYKRHDQIEEKTQIDVKICELLKKIGIPQHILGYKYLQEAIFMVYENEELVHSVTKELYPAIAKKYNTIWARVERGIKHAIDKAFDYGDESVLEKVFGRTQISKEKHPNSCVIAALAEYVKMYS